MGAAGETRDAEPTGSAGETRGAEPSGVVLADTHVHLNLKAFRRDREEAIARAESVGVGLLVNVGFDLPTSRSSIELAESHDSIYASVGLHPHDAEKLDDDLLAEIERLAAHPKVVAIGETGLDYYRNLSPASAQRTAFEAQLRLAQRLDLPVIIHNRDALDDVLSVIDSVGGLDAGGVMHCFPGDADYAHEVIRRGFHVGLGGPVTYSQRGRLVSVAKEIRMDRLLLETDAPWLAPAPHRGKRNEPSYVAIVAETISRLRGIDLADLGRATTGNAIRLFGIEQRPAPAIAYEMWGNLYLNITNRCTNDCSFCIRFQTDVLWGYNLRLNHEPTIEEVADAIGDPTGYREVVFCGYGEPTVRLDVVKEIGARIKASGVKVRIDTNGHGSLIWNRNIAPELAAAADAVSVSLNAQDAASYEDLCHPRFGDKTFDHVVSFIQECKKAGLKVTVSAVDVGGVDIPGVRELAARLDVPLWIRGTGERRPPGGVKTLPQG